MLTALNLMFSASGWSPFLAPEPMQCLLLLGCVFVPENIKICSVLWVLLVWYYRHPTTTKLPSTTTRYNDYSSQNRANKGPGYHVGNYEITVKYFVRWWRGDYKLQYVTSTGIANYFDKLKLWDLFLALEFLWAVEVVSTAACCLKSTIHNILVLLEYITTGFHELLQMYSDCLLPQSHRCDDLDPNPTSHPL